MTTSSETLSLSTLFEQHIPGIDAFGGRSLAAACMVCLHRHEHQDNVGVTIGGWIQHQCSIHWLTHPIEDSMLRFWNDNDRAAEWGAEAIAVLLVLKFTEFTIVDRSRKGTGFDYWLARSDDEPLFAYKGRLEVSGLFQGTEAEVRRRLKQKVEQTKKSDHLALDAFAVVVEFSRPTAQIVRR